MNRAILGSAGLLTLLTGCSPEEAPGKERVSPTHVVRYSEGLEQAVQPEIFIDTPATGHFLNHGRGLETGTPHELWGVNGCNAVVLYAASSEHPSGIVTHYQPGYRHVLANGEKLMSLAQNNPSLVRAKEQWATIFHVTPNNADEEHIILGELYFLTSIMKVAYGDGLKVSYQGYDMEPPGSKLDTPSLRIDLQRQSITSEWHGVLPLMFSTDSSFNYPFRFIGQKEHAVARKFFEGPLLEGK